MSDVNDIIKLSDLLAELSAVKRATKLPNGEYETDAHHSFSLALIAYHICDEHQLDLNREKLLLFALVHDLLEIVTGDEDTLHHTSADNAAKHQREQEAVEDFNALFANYPSLAAALHEYEKLDTPEAATIFVLDKACTTWTHFHDGGEYLRVERGIATLQDLGERADVQRLKLKNRLKAQPPRAVMDVYDNSLRKMEELFE